MHDSAYCSQKIRNALLLNGIDMGIFNKLFGKLRGSEPESTPDRKDDGILVYDAKGNQYSIARTDYVAEVLTEKFAKTKNDPDELYNVLVLTLHDEFFEECLQPAERLFQIDPDKERSSAILGIALMKNGRLDDAQELLEDYLRKNGDSGVIMTNLAKILAEKGREEESMQCLWKSLMIDPNQENAFGWWVAIHNDKGGDEAFHKSVDQVADLAGSWRPQLWKARWLLEQKKIDSALDLYDKVLNSAKDDPDAYTMISGDLGNNGYLIQMVDLLLPIYDAEKHGAYAGINLIKACITLGKKDSARSLCDSIGRQKRPDLIQYMAELRDSVEKLN
jgi:tetratricopeptide (TPR) repeat protein